MLKEKKIAGEKRKEGEAGDEAEDEDEYAIMLAKSTMNEKLPNSPQFNTDDYDRVTVAAAQTGDLVVSGADEDYALYKLTISAAAAQVVDVFWTDSANANIEYWKTFFC